MIHVSILNPVMIKNNYASVIAVEPQDLAVLAREDSLPKRNRFFR
jgi:hypothetical protein